MLLKQKDRVRERKRSISLGIEERVGEEDGIQQRVDFVEVKKFEWGLNFV